MGGRPVIALNIMMFPASKLPIEAYSEIIRGGADIAAEAGLRIIGGHTIDDYPPKYGLAVVGYVHPGRIATNSGAQPGDSLILTKPIGTGVIMAGKKLGLSSPEDLRTALNQMKILNKSGAEVMNRFGIRGATDITGFGLAGHALKMARASKVTISIEMKKVPLIGDTYSLIDQGCIPGAAFRNLDYAEKDTSFSAGLDYNLKMLAFDAQTSGGLLISVPSIKCKDMLSELHNSGLTHSAVIGKVTERTDSLLNLR